MCFPSWRKASSGESPVALRIVVNILDNIRGIRTFGSLCWDHRSQAPEPKLRLPGQAIRRHQQRPAHPRSGPVGRVPRQAELAFGYDIHCGGVQAPNAVGSVQEQVREVTILAETKSSGGVRLQRQTMAGQVALELRRRILAGELTEGTQLRQEQLAAEFGISKVPVREALHQLEAEGFVTQQFHKGAVVAGLSPEEIMEAFELRTQIELWLLGLAMQSATPEDIANARAIAAQIGQVDDAEHYPALNWRFHEALYRPAKRPFAIDHLQKLHAQIERYVRLQFSIAQTKETVLREHTAILNLYEKRDPEALEYLRRHIMGSAQELLDRLRALNPKRETAGANDG